MFQFSSIVARGRKYKNKHNHGRKTFEKPPKAKSRLNGKLL